MKERKNLQINLVALNNHILEVASMPQDMDALGNKLHALQGDLAHHWAVSVSGNWRLTFSFEGEDAILVDYQDHQGGRIMIFNPAHPGEVLKDYLGEITVAEASRRLSVTRAHLSRVLNGKAGMSASMSLRLSGAAYITGLLAKDADTA